MLRGIELRDVLRPTWSWGVVLLLVLLTLPVTLLDPTAIDVNYRAALDVAWREGIQFGNGIDYTYGPLGFLHVPAGFFVSHARAALAWNIGLDIAYCAVAFTLARQSVRAVGAFVLTLFAAGYTFYFLAPPYEALAVAGALAALRAPAGSPATRVLALGGGAGAALVLMLKLNSGITVLAIAAIALCFAEAPLRRLGELAAAFAASLVALWVVLGQGLGNLWSFLAAGRDIVSGYSAAMSQSLASDGPTQLLLAILITVALVAATWLITKELDRRRRIGAVLVVAVFGAATLKAGFVRPDGHQVLAFGSLLAVVPVLGWSRGQWAAPVGLVLACVLVLDHYYEAPPDARNPVARAGDSVDRIRDVFGSGLEHRIPVSRAQVAEQLAVPPRLAALLRGHTVHFEPDHARYAWLDPKVRWRPFPVFQGFVTYTDKLDRRNADFVRSDRAPERILRTVPYISIDGRLTQADAPRTRTAMLCRYHAIATAPGWQVLQRGPNRCGDRRPMGEVKTRVGAVIRVPPPPAGHVVLVEVSGAGLDAADRLRALLYKLGPRQIQTAGANLRVVPETFGSPTIWRAAPGADFPGERGSGVAVGTSSFRVVPTGGLGNDDLTVRFSTMRVAPVTARAIRPDG